MPDDIAAVLAAWAALPAADQSMLARSIADTLGWAELVRAEARVHALNTAWNALEAREQTLCGREIVDCLAWSVVDAPPLYPPHDPLSAPLSLRKRLMADLWRSLPPRERARFLAVATDEGFQAAS